MINLLLILFHKRNQMTIWRWAGSEDLIPIKMQTDYLALALGKMESKALALALGKPVKTEALNSNRHHTLKYSRVSLNTTGLNKSKAIKLGTAIKAFSVSATNQIKFN